MSSQQVLFIDAGNTRLKWRLESGSTVLAEDSVTYREDADRLGQLALPAHADCVWIGSVAGDIVDRQLQERLTTIANEEPWFVAVQSECLGLSVAYADTTRLGVDRYLAMLGARQRSTAALCIVDVGTAMTLDAVDPEGAHYGGLITPGPRTMIDSLLRGTARIADASEISPDTPFARDTSEAVTGGAVYACAALIDRFVAEFEQRVEAPVSLFLTGGDAERIAPRLRTMAISAPDLVFDGLRALANAKSDTYVP